MGWWPGTPSIPGPVTSSNGRASLDTGVGGVFMSKLLGHVRRKMLRVGLPPVLDDLDPGRHSPPWQHPQAQVAGVRRAAQRR